MTQQITTTQEPFSIDFVAELNRDQLQQLRLAIDSRLENLRSEEILIANRQMKEIASRLGYSDPSELMSEASQIKVPTKSSKKNTVRSVATPKYWNPHNKSQTWSERGKVPKWLTKLMQDEGTQLSDYLIPADYIAEVKAGIVAKNNALTASK